MHGRVKVRTTEEQREIAKKEKARKAVAFRETITKIFEKRSAGVFDQEGLTLSWNLLNENPDVTTLWNYRREIFLKFKNETEEEEYQKLLEKDLSLTEQCLRVNPKSYGSWHHRIWILDNLPEPNWNREMKLCTKCLQLDERNFHCWDYRRIIAKRSNVSDHSEYEYTLEKINENFSNYSAWHLRSKLLPKIFPDPENRFPISETKREEELELIESAAFTDPNDQSAWFYLRWLLGFKEPKTRFLHLKKDENILMLISNAVKLEQNDGAITHGVRIRVEVNGDVVKGTWTNCNGQPQSCLWIFKPVSKVDSEDSVSCILVENETESERIDLSTNVYVAEGISFIPEYSPGLRKTISYLLKSFNELLEIEPDSKWTLLTKVFLMACIDRDEFENQIKKGLETLEEIDPMRRGYYRDLRSKLVVEMILAKDKKFPCSKEFTAAAENLSCLRHAQYLWSRETVDLSNNELSSDSATQFYTFINCKNLNLNCNKITDLSGFPGLSKLEILSMENNLIEEFDWKFLKRFPKLKRINLGGNPVADKLNLIDYSGSVEIVCSSKA